MRFVYRTVTAAVIAISMVACPDSDVIPFAAAKDLGTEGAHVSADAIRIVLANHSEYFITRLTIEVVRHQERTNVYDFAPMNVAVNMAPGSRHVVILPRNQIAFTEQWVWRPNTYRRRPRNWNSDFAGETDDPSLSYQIVTVRGYKPGAKQDAPLRIGLRRANRGMA